MESAFLLVYQVKLAEYLLCIGYLLLFVGFWRFINSESNTEKAEVRS